MSTVRKSVYLLPLILIIFTACTTSPQNVDYNYTFKNSKMGLLACRIHNDTAGITGLYTYNGRELPFTLKLNSNIDVLVYPFSLHFMRIKNTIRGQQIVLIPLKEGRYYIARIGKTTDFMWPYMFSIEANKINYIGDLKIELLEMNGSLIAWPTDNYRLKVEDRFIETIQLMQTVYPELLMRYETINQSQPTEDFLYPMFREPD